MNKTELPLEVFKYCQAEDLESHKNVNPDWGALVVRNVEDLPRREFDNIVVLSIGSDTIPEFPIAHHRITQPAELARFTDRLKSLNSYIGMLVVAVTPRTHHALSQYATRHGPLMAKDVILGILPFRTRILTIKPRIIDELIYSSGDIKFEKPTIRDPTIIKSPSIFRSDYARRIFLKILLLFNEVGSSEAFLN